MQKSVILCYGDSNTHGMTPIADPLNPVCGRYDHDVRWPKVMAEKLGAGVEVIEEGLPGRTTAVDDPNSGSSRNGLTYLLPCLNSHFPLDVIILMLGTNDVKADFHRSPQEISAGIEMLLDVITAAQIGRDGKQPAILLVAPPPIVEIEKINMPTFTGGEEKSRQLAVFYAEIAARRKLAFFDAGKAIAVSPVDGVHFSAETHQHLGEIMAEKIKDLLP